MGFTGRRGFIGVHKGTITVTPTLLHEGLGIPVARVVPDEDHDSAADDEVFSNNIEKMTEFMESIVD